MSVFRPKSVNFLCSRRRYRWTNLKQIVGNGETAPGTSQRVTKSLEWHLAFFYLLHLIGSSFPKSPLNYICARCIFSWKIHEFLHTEECYFFCLFPPPRRLCFHVCLPYHFAPISVKGWGMGQGRTCLMLTWIRVKGSDPGIFFNHFP